MISVSRYDQNDVTAGVSRKVVAVLRYEEEVLLCRRISDRLLQVGQTVLSTICNARRVCCSYRRMWPYYADEYPGFHPVVHNSREKKSTSPVASKQAENYE